MTCTKRCRGCRRSFTSKRGTILCVACRDSGAHAGELRCSSCRAWLPEADFERGARRCRNCCDKAMKPVDERTGTTRTKQKMCFTCCNLPHRRQSPVCPECGLPPSGTIMLPTGVWVEREEHDRLVARLREFVPRVLPPEWRDMEQEVLGGLGWRSRDGLRVIASLDTEDDDKRWLHVSFSRKDRIPSYHDCCRVKELFIGPDRKAIQIFPPRAEHVNYHPNCLHLFSCLDEDVLPDFRKAGLI